MWFLAQYVRFGMLKSNPDFKGIAEKLILDDLYAEVAREAKVPVMTDDMKAFKTTYDVLFDPANISAYLASAKK